MLVLMLAVLLVAFFPFSAGHFFSPSHPDPLFMISHASSSHLAMNIVSLVLVWLMAQRTGEDERRLMVVFLVSSIVPLFIPVLFAQPIIGASAGVYGMIGYLLPDLVGMLPLQLSYAALLPVILLEECFLCKPWSKLFHVFGLTVGVVLHYMWDINSIALKRTALQLNLGTDYYSLLSLGYPRGYVDYDLPD